MLTKREEQLFHELSSWEQDLMADHRSDFVRTYHHWIEQRMNEVPVALRKKVAEKVDQAFFYIHSIIQNSDWLMESRKRLLNNARLYSENISSIQDLKTLSIDHLHYLAEMEVSKHRLYSLLQGAITGTGGAFFLGLDLPSQLVINLRAVQMIAMSYGNEVNAPYEMMLALKVFHASFMPPHLKYEAWVDLKKEITEPFENPYFYYGSDQLANEQTIENLIKQIIKLFVMQMLKKKKVQNIPIFSVALGAGINYQMTKACTTYAHKFYQYRLLLERKRNFT